MQNQEKLEFNDEAVKSIAAFQNVLKRIHIRLISEGYVIKNGLITKPKIDFSKTDDDNDAVI